MLETDRWRLLIKLDVKNRMLFRVLALRRNAPMLSKTKCRLDIRSQHKDRVFHSSAYEVSQKARNFMYWTFVCLNAYVVDASDLI